MVAVTMDSHGGKIMKKMCLLNRKGSTVRRAVLAAMCVTCALSVSACGKKDNRIENKDPITGEDQSQTNESGSTEGSSEGGSDMAGGDHSEFDAMINDENTDPNSIINYINTNIAGAAADDVERFFTGLLSFGDDIRNIDFTGLEESRSHMPEDMIAFMELMRLEGDTPSMVMSDEGNRKEINMTLLEMLERARLYEQHLERFPNGVTADAASRLYEELATSAITGGYNKAEGVEHFYKGDSNDTIDQKALEYYQRFAQANPDSNLGKIVKEYIEILQTNDFKINDNMEKFYRELQGRFDVSSLTTNGANAGQSDGTGAGNTGTTGTGNNGAGNTGTAGTGNTGAGNSGAGNTGTTGTGNNGAGNTGTAGTGNNGVGNNGAGNTGTAGTGNNGVGNTGTAGTGNNGAGNTGTTGTGNNSTNTANGSTGNNRTGNTGVEMSGTETSSVEGSTETVR